MEKPRTPCNDDGRRDSLVRLEPELRRRARQLTRSEADASDLLQDTFERALRTDKAPAVEREFRPWLMRMMVNLWIDKLRSAKRGKQVALDLDLHGPAVPSPADEGSQWRHHSLSEVRSALGELAEPLRTVYRMHAMEGRSYAELAEVMSVRPATVGTRLLRARRTLREILERRQETRARYRAAA